MNSSRSSLSICWSLASAGLWWSDFCLHSKLWEKPTYKLKGIFRFPVLVVTACDRLVLLPLGYGKATQTRELRCSKSACFMPGKWPEEEERTRTPFWLWGHTLWGLWISPNPQLLGMCPTASHTSLRTKPSSRPQQMPTLKLCTVTHLQGPQASRARKDRPQARAYCRSIFLWAGEVAQRVSTCLACTRPGVQPLLPWKHTNKQIREKETPSFDSTLLPRWTKPFLLGHREADSLCTLKVELSCRNVTS